VLRRDSSVEETSFFQVVSQHNCQTLAEVVFDRFVVTGFLLIHSVIINPHAKILLDNFALEKLIFL
jgi:hypothetical protein